MTQQQSGANRVSLACVQCRSRHLRCDAVTPICSRCVREKSECTYPKSRRGGRARAKRDGTTTASDSTLIQSTSKAIPRTLPERESLPSLTPDHSGSSSTSASNLGADDYLGWFPESDSGPLTRVPLLELYYTYFHPAQPCALPLRFLRQVASEDSPGIRLLVNVLQFIGSLYAPKVDSGPLEDLVKASLEEPRPKATGFEIQALVLYSIAVYWCDEIDRARDLLDEATRKATGIGMNFRAFAIEQSGGDPVLAESWRRTWWQLYSTDAHIASSNHVAHFGTSQRLIPCTVELPCEEDEYCLGAIPTPSRTTEEYDNREFAEDDSDFSSFAYLIGLGRSLDHTIIGIPRLSEANVKIVCTNADSCISAWLSLLSKKKRRFFREDGTLDELLFKANFLIQIYTVDIHRYLSTLAYTSIESVSTCAPPPPPDRLGPIYSRDAHIHTAKILRAIERIADMLTLPVRLARHTPFNICMIATMTVAHLSACKYVFTGEELKVARERIRVAMGALEVFAEIWPRGKKVVGEVKIIARTLLSLEPRPRQSSITSPKPIGYPLVQQQQFPNYPISQSESPQDRFLYSGGAQSPQDLPADDLRTTVAQSYIDCGSLPIGQEINGYFDFPGIGFDMDMDAFASNDLCSDLSLKTGFPFHLDVPIPY